MKVTRIGFVGVGTMGQMAHLRNYAVLPQCEVAAVAELRERTGRAVANRYHIPKVYRSAEEMLESEDLDAVVASQPFTRHGQIVPALCKHGKPIFTEKPLASSIMVGERILEAVSTSSAFLMLGYHKRSDPAVEWAQKAIAELRASRSLGDLTYIRILMPAGDWIAHGFDELIVENDPAPALDLDPLPQDESETRRAEYVAFVNYYIHQVNMMRYLLGESYRPVFADRGGKLLVAESDSGVTCTIEMSPYRTTIGWQEEILVAFEGGWIKIALPAPLALNRPGSVTVYADPEGDDSAGGPGSSPLNGALTAGTPVELSPTLPWIHAMRRQAENFIAAVRGEIPPRTDAAEALEDLRVARQYLDLFDAARAT